MEHLFVLLLKYLRLKREYVAGSSDDAVLVENLLVQARLRTPLRPPTAVQRFFGRLTLVVVAVRPVYHVAYRETLGAPVLNYQHLIDV